MTAKGYTQMKNLEQKIFEYLAANLSPKRFEHSYQVAKLASELAAAHGADVLKAQTAGLLHDCAKSMSDKQLVNFCRKHAKKIKYFDGIRKNAPYLLHCYAGAVIAKEKLGIKDADILNAIINHTLGRENMSALEKIIFIADSASYDRKCGACSKMRALAKKDLDAGFLAALANKIKYVVESMERICGQTIDTWNYYAKEN
ncbi:MAG: bis(5'-nucleosyl)-tetraphosphatase (symmetrical) YqeK [Endomicrobia bacterium]|nr:bis(5'-nucleosyl)-tetraphosphatase (symmetrical) YqeK [Endomicrobiia bacterium]